MARAGPGESGPAGPRRQRTRGRRRAAWGGVQNGGALPCPPAIRSPVRPRPLSVDCLPPPLPSRVPWLRRADSGRRAGRPRPRRGVGGGGLRRSDAGRRPGGSRQGLEQQVENGRRCEASRRAAAAAAAGHDLDVAAGVAVEAVASDAKQGRAQRRGDDHPHALGRRLRRAGGAGGRLRPAARKPVPDEPPRRPSKECKGSREWRTRRPGRPAGRPASLDPGACAALRPDMPPAAGAADDAGQERRARRKFVERGTASLRAGRGMADGPALATGPTVAAGPRTASGRRRPALRLPWGSLWASAA